VSIEYLIGKYTNLVYKICYDMLRSSLDAEDTTQEVFLKLYLNIDRYISLSENEIKNVICKIALNMCKDILKSKARKLQNMIDENNIALENYMENNNIDEEIFNKQRLELIKKNLDELKEPYGSILYEYFLEEKTLDEIANKRNVNKATLKMQIHRGKKILKEKLLESGGENLL